ncbi:hypothetical protein EWM64_g9647 [Hericium alpestre]|uniref:Uncharacterized protein n=1 Tax=Hericium alpestre TaxID=135208 RepID=A0A4Y9ZI02_9AGAM|nr:hypothetical protein EWM64_g9647 [Hericium alpestre]
MLGKAKDPRDFWSSIATSRLSDLGILSPSVDASIEDMHRQALDDEIAAMSAALSGLKERRNALYRNAKFPPEVLEHIFSYATLNEVPGQGRTKAVKALGCVDARAMESKVYEILGWVKLTHVCRAWRAIAFANGNSWLWSTMDTGRLSKAGMREILNRSHHHPITPKITLSVDLDELEVFHILLEPGYLSRLKSLQIAADERIHSDDIIRGRGMFDHADNILCSLTHYDLPAPGLMIESLAVAYNDDSSFVVPLPYGLLAPHLRHLTLKNMQLSLNRDIVTYPQLTHLDITVDLQKIGNRDDSVDEFVEFLGGSPSLQVLRLIGSIPHMDYVEPLDEEDMETLRVDLLHLEELRLDGTDRDCALFGQYLNIADSCSITINALPGMTTANQPYGFLGSILRRWAQSPVRLDILSGYPVIRISTWNAAAGASTDGSGESKRTPHIDKPPRLHLTAKRFLTAENLIGVCSPQWWWELFPDARTVQRLSVDGAAAVNALISALDPSVSRLFGQQHDQPLFPGLKTLCLHHWNPSEVIENYDLHRCLQARRDDGLGTVMDIELGLSDGTLPSAEFEPSLAESEGLGLATFHIKVDQGECHVR